MRKLIVFNHVSVDGYFSSPHGDISWFKTGDAELAEYAIASIAATGALVFGRVTYELMTHYWPTPMAKKNDPVLAEWMNSLPKIVFSRTLARAAWNNTRLVRENLEEEIRKLKKEPGKHMALLGSGSIITQLAPLGLIDEYQIMVNPIALGTGRTLFEGIRQKLTLKLAKTREFRNGCVLLTYAP